MFAFYAMNDWASQAQAHLIINVIVAKQRNRASGSPWSSPNQDARDLGLTTMLQMAQMDMKIDRRAPYLRYTN